MRQDVERAQRAKILYDLWLTGIGETEDIAGIWSRLYEEFGYDTVQAMIALQPVTTVPVSGGHLILIDGYTYACSCVAGETEALQWNIKRVTGQHEPYRAYKFPDGTIMCDCASWVYSVDGSRSPHCKHLWALASLGLI